MENIFKNKVILITGGTGYLGRKLTKEILKFDPQSIRLFSRDEVKHHKIQEEFNNHPKLRNLLGVVIDYNRIRKACEGVDILIHAAALKRLDILEYNVDQSIKTNILGTLNVVDACLESNVDKAIFISTDKACSPVNTYGACKFVGERIFTESNYSKGKKRTKFTVVRYGNVLESTGSVIPFFTKKILDGQKLPLTDKRMTRFIISPNQAVELIFKALKYCNGGEIFVPKLPAFKITDLITILKNKYKANNEVEVIGIRPGEKIHEQMINSAEVPKTYNFKDMYVITSCIHEYNDQKDAIYFLPENKLHEKDMIEYNSKDSVISLGELEKLFKSLELI